MALEALTLKSWTGEAVGEVQVGSLSDSDPYCLPTSKGCYKILHGSQLGDD